MGKGVFLIIVLFLISFSFISASDFGYDNPELPNIERIDEYIKDTGDSVTGTFDFNGGWMNEGLTISGGDIYAQTGYFYNITSLNVTRQNLTILDDLNVFGNINFTGLIYGDGSGLTYPFTAGSVLFSDGSTIAEDNYNLYWDNAANQLEPNLIRITSAGSAASPALNFNDDDTGIYSGGSNIISFSTDGTHRMSIDATGQVGIGTTSPASLLHIVTGDPGANQEVVQVNYTNPGGRYAYEITEDASGNNFGFQLWSGGLTINDILNNVNIITFQNDTGNVGIGTTSPTHKLNVVGDINVTGDIYSNNYQVLSYQRTVNIKNVTMTAVI